MAARIPMMATTTKSSISVKPDSLCNLNFCIYSISFSIFTWFYLLLIRYLEGLSCDYYQFQDRTRSTFNPSLHSLLRAFRVRRITAGHAKAGPGVVEVSFVGRCRRVGGEITTTISYLYFLERINMLARTTSS